MTHHDEYDAHGCVLRRDVNEMKKDLAEMKATQHEMMNEMREGMQRITTAIENLEKSSRNVTNMVYSMNGDIVVIGGLSFEPKETLCSVERFNFYNQTWTQMAELEVGRCFSQAVLFENQILVCGGSTSSSYSDCIDSIEALDLTANPPAWQQFAVDLPIEMFGHKCVVYGNRLLIIGGQMKGGAFLGTIYELLLVPPYSSKLLCHMKTKRAFHGAELFGSKVLIAGGVGAEADVEVFDITRNECAEMPPLSSPRKFMATVCRDDAMLLIGGGDTKENGREIVEYDFKTGQSKVPVVASKSKGNSCSAVCSGNTLVIVGSLGDSQLVTAFNFVSNSWKKLPRTTAKRHFPSVVLVNHF